MLFTSNVRFATKPSGLKDTSLRCHFTKDNEEQALALKKGQMVTVSGGFRMTSPGWIWLKDCLVEESL